MRSAVESGTRRSGIEAERTTPSRGRRLLTMAEERLSEDGRTKLLNLLEAGDPKGEVATAWATPRRPSESSTATRINHSLFAGLTSSALTWPTGCGRRRSAHSGARSSAGDPRSPPGMPVTSRMARPRP